MAATNQYMNVGPVTWLGTAPSVSVVTLTHIKSVKFDPQLSQKKDSADFDYYPTFSVSDFSDPMISLEVTDSFLMYATPTANLGTLVVTIRDLYNGATASGGAKTITMTNARKMSESLDAVHREYGKKSMTFSAISVDGATSPVSFAAL